MRDPVVVMVAPNGARRQKADHPALPITHDETVEAVTQAHRACAQAAHVHVRGEDGRHVLDAERYLRLLAALAEACPDLVVQITTEAVGRYTPAEQRALVAAVKPAAVSIAFQELLADPAEDAVNRDFLAWAQEAGIAIQWIVYAPDQLAALAEKVAIGVVPPPRALLFVLGRYAKDQESRPADLLPFLAERQRHTALRDVAWSLCAFGRGETACLIAGLLLGGDARIGFENSLWHADGTVADDNAERVAALTAITRQLGLTLATAAETRQRLIART